MYRRGAWVRYTSSNALMSPRSHRCASSRSAALTSPTPLDGATARDGCRIILGMCRRRCSRSAVSVETHESCRFEPLLRGPWRPAHGREAPHSPERHFQAFGAQPFTFRFEMSGPAAQGAAGADDSVTRRCRVTTLTEDGPDSTPRTRRPRESRDVAVCTHPTPRNTTDGRKDA